MFKNKTPDTRNPKDVANRIVAILQESTEDRDKDVAELLNSEITYWPPEFFKKNLSSFINKKIQKNPDDKVCIKVYAELCNVPPEEIQYILMVFSGRIA
jgi:hypothetical protein